VDEAELIARARHGSRQAGRELVLRHWPTIWRVVYAMTGRPALAEEIAQETFARAFGALERFDAERPLGPWLRRIAVNRTIDELRRERRLEVVDPAVLDSAYEETLPDDATIDAVRRLDPERRAVVVLRFWLDGSQTHGIAKAVPSLDLQPFALRDQTGRVISPRPLGRTKLSLCPK
jgi:RNA polymerase sigma-70 factor (ECF subfamily)